MKLKLRNYIIIMLVLNLLYLFFSCATIIPPNAWEDIDHTVGTITKVEKSSITTYISYSFFTKEGKINIKRGVYKSEGDFIFYPEGAMFYVEYSPRNPEEHRCIYFYRPVFDPKTNFKNTKAKVYHTAKIHSSHGCGRFGGLVIAYEFFVNREKYVGTSAFDLDKVSHLFGDKMRHLRKGFLDNYFEVKYDVDNPALSRLVLEGVEE